MVVITPSRQLQFGAVEPVAEFLEHRVRWVELLPEHRPPNASLFQRLLGLLLESEAQITTSSRLLRQQAAATGTPWAAELDDVIAAILVTRFPSRSIPEVCAMGGITVEDFTQSRIYKEILGIGVAEGEARGEARVTLRQLNRRCGALSAATIAQIEALPLEKLEALAEALLDFQGPDDLANWLSALS